MKKLDRAQDTIEVLQKYHFTTQKRYGQNFLIDKRVVDKIVDAAQITKEDFVIEIGPGIGTMTQALLEQAGEVVAIEVDAQLIPILQDTLSGYDNVSVIHGDVLKTDLTRIIEEKNGGKPCKIVANLPYYITTPILMEVLERRVPVKSITVMVQKEVAQRMQAQPGTKDYGALSLAVQYFTEPFIVANVPPNCFIPRPKVGSAVIRLVAHGKSPVDVSDEAHLFRLIRASFNQRRKTLVNGLYNAQGLTYSKDQIAGTLREMGLSEQVRGETLSLLQFAELSNRLLTLN